MYRPCFHLPFLGLPLLPIHPNSGDQGQGCAADWHACWREEGANPGGDPNSPGLQTREASQLQSPGDIARVRNAATKYKTPYPEGDTNGLTLTSDAVGALLIPMRSFLNRRSSSDSAVRLDPALTKRTHFAYLDGVRGIMALFVVSAHAYWNVWPLEYGEQPSAQLRPWLSPLLYSRFAITVFIVLSAYCLSLAVVRDGGLLRRGAAGFYRGRARRVLPPFFAGIALSLLLVWTLVGKDTGTHWDINVPVSWEGYVGNLLLVQNVFGAGQLNASYWSIGAEIQLYLIFPLLVLLWRRAGIFASAAVAVAGGFVGVFLIEQLRDHGHPLPAAAPVFLALFGLGMLGAAISFSDDPRLTALRERVPWIPLGVVFSATIAWLNWHWSFLEALQYFAYLDFLGGLATLSFIVAASRPRPSRLRSVLGLRPLAILGTFSFSIYLVHLPLLQVQRQYAVDRLDLSKPMTFLVMVTFGAAAIVGFAYLFHLAFERPFMSSRQRRAADGEFVETGSPPARPAPSPSGAAGGPQAVGHPSVARDPGS